MNGKKIEFKQAESTKELATIRSLAKEIWPPVYSPILSEEQLDYMMEMMYSMPVLHRETEEEGIKYYIVMKDNLPIGFTSFGPYEDGVAKLHKLYLDEKFRGNGFGRQMIEFIADKAREEGYTRLILNVNRENAPSIAVYHACGLKELGEVDAPIGNGFYMNDYIMGMDL